MKIPIICYHRLTHIMEKGAEKYSVSKEEFRKQLQYLSDNKFKTVYLTDLIEPQFDVEDNQKIIVITFDDGIYSDYSIAFPLLREYNFTATFFITVSWIGSERYMSWSNIEEMASSGMSIQSHTMTHPFLSDLHGKNLYKELHESKKILKERLNKSIEFLSLPGGAYSAKVLKMASTVGYKDVCTSRPGLETPTDRGARCSGMSRFIITSQTSLEEFKAIVHGVPQKVKLKQIKYHISRNLRRMLGNQNYHAIWSKLFKKA